MNELILATNNQGKLIELQAILAPIQCIPQKDLGIDNALETGLSFIENALIKARHASRLAGKPALADDSGLVVPALDGQPGIYSARFAGNHATDQENMEHLLNQLTSLPKDRRQAYFYCALALVQHANDPTPIIATGKLLGTIHSIAQGDNGFGYDPIFYLPEQQCTLAEVPLTFKNTLSHRAIALRNLCDQL